MRIGFGYDIHPLEDGIPLVLGGITIPHSSGCKAHSDGDVVIHALCDALLGAAGLGDIGQLFPSSDPKWKNRNSRYFLEEILQLITVNGWEIANIDLLIQAEKPVLNPYFKEMRHQLSQILNLQSNQINLKAGTNEKLGPIGQEKAIACYAVCLLQSRL